ncbi:hypothetical protein Vafri_20481 [Volvox africanus]|uniref:Uncharacterized protein n=1 Tax=Volvox africanus TaxID=51714 RepID=A0A8J4BSA7_9CHLO|nr:hypothetical protein Vafri_20481 [Volvox africanus]
MSALQLICFADSIPFVSGALKALTAQIPGVSTTSTRLEAEGDDEGCGKDAQGRPGSTVGHVALPATPCRASFGDEGKQRKVHWTWRRRVWRPSVYTAGWDASWGQPAPSSYVQPPALIPRGLERYPNN